MQMQISVWYKILSKVSRWENYRMWGFLCSVHCKLEQLNYSSLVAVIKYGDGPRTAEGAELPELIRLRSGSNGKRGSAMGPDSVAADGGTARLLAPLQYFVGHPISGQGGPWHTCSLPVFLPFLGPCSEQLQEGCPELGHSKGQKLLQ